MSGLVLNPNLVVRPLLMNDSVVAYSLVALVKGRGRLQNTVEIAGTNVHVISVLRGLVAADADVDVADSACAALTRLGVLVHEDQVSRAVRFSCRIHADEQITTTDLTVNPGFVITAFADFIKEERVLSRVLESCEEIALVTDPVTKVRYPYWIDHRERALLNQLVPGAPPPSELERADVCRFALAGILIDKSAVVAARQRLRAAGIQFARHGYVELPQLLPPLQLAALRAYYRRLLDEGHVADHDRQVNLRFALHNERLMQYYHRELCTLFARIASQSIKPSYGYFSSYRRGATLKKHVDREQCKYTASLLLDYVGALSNEQTWPLYLEMPATGQRVAVHLKPGDSVLFLGCELPHYRHALQGDCSTSLFLHYVDEAFSRDLK